MIRVLLADDEMIIRSGVKSILHTDQDIEVVAEASEGLQAVELARSHRPDVALLDIRMPHFDGLRAARELGSVMPNVKRVMLTTFDDDNYIAQALSDGASGFLLKASDPRELLVAVRAVADGAVYLSPRIAHRVVTRFDSARLSRDGAAHGKIARLTPRETEVLTLLTSGLSNQEIARELRVTEGTVKTHVSTILVRLEVRNRVEAAVLGYQANLILAMSRLLSIVAWTRIDLWTRGQRYGRVGFGIVLPPAFGWPRWRFVPDAPRIATAIATATWIVLRRSAKPPQRGTVRSGSWSRISTSVFQHLTPVAGLWTRTGIVASHKLSDLSCAQVNERSAKCPRAVETPGSSPDAAC